MASGPRASPGRASSSPVASTATRGLRKHRHARMVHRGRQRHVGGAEPQTGRKQHLALAEILARGAHVPAERFGLEGGDAAGLGPRVFLHQDRIGALGKRRAGEDPDGLAGFESAPKTATCRAFADEGERDRRCRNIHGT